MLLLLLLSPSLSHTEGAPPPTTANILDLAQGFKHTAFHGNFFIRGSDLLALPNVNSNSTFAFEFGHDGSPVISNVVCVQSALLYTTSSGERRIRVNTVAAPLSTTMSEIIDSVDVDAVCNIIAKQAVNVAKRSGLEEARNSIQRVTSQIMRAARPAAASYGAAASSTAPPPSLQLLPLYAMCMIKNMAFRGGVHVPADIRSYFMHRILASSVSFGFKVF